MSDRRVSVRLTRRYDAAPSDVWAALTEPDSLRRWLGLPQELKLSPGGAFQVVVAGEPPEVLAGRVREVEPQRLLELDWRYPGEQPSIVRFELSGDGQETILVLDHRRLEERLGEAYGAGWTRYLDRLAAEIGR